MDRRPAKNPIRRIFWDHERTLVAVSVIGLLLVGGILSMGIIVSRIRMPVLDGVEQLLNYWDDRWTRRVEYGERLVSAKKYSQAVEYLVALDRDFPARNVRHKRDGERERVLRALGRSYAELGKKKLTLDTFRRLVEFDPRNFENHHLFAQASLKFHETDLAEKQLVKILTIHPTHMPSVRTQLKNHFDKSSYAAVVAAYEHYLNAFLIQTITVALGQSSIQVNVPVDGRYHDVDLRLMQSPGGAAELALQVGEYAIDIERVTLQAPLVVGQTGVAITPIWPSQTSWQVQEMERVGEGSFRALGRGASLRLKVPAQPQEIAAVHLRLRLFKSIDSDMWKMVALSYQRLLRYDDLKTAQARSVIGSPK